MHLRYGLAVILAAALAGLGAPPSSADPMKFHGNPPSRFSPLMGTAWNVFAEGEIVEGTDESLRQFLLANNVPRRSLLFLDSPGGSLMAGMKLGKILREHQLFLYVGKDANQKQYETAGPGECYSACALAFLGGVYRFYHAGSEYGVHRFYKSTPGLNDSDMAQIVSAMIIQYIRDMGTDPELFSYMSRAGSTELVKLTEQDMARLKVVNGGVQPTKWTIESHVGVLYLKGERETWRGINKFILFCDPKSGRTNLYVIFDPEGRGREVVEELPAHALMINGELTPISNYRIGPTELVNGWINARYALTNEILGKIAVAKTVGVAMQHTYQSPFFMGFDGMEFAIGREKFPGLLNTCRRTGAQR